MRLKIIKDKSEILPLHQLLIKSLTLLRILCMVAKVRIESTDVLNEMLLELLGNDLEGCSYTVQYTAGLNIYKKFTKNSESSYI